MSSKAKAFGHLLTDVIRKGRCTSCGACEATCPIGSIRMERETPKLIGLCIACSICYNNCPRAVFDDAEVDRHVFGRVRGEGEADLGIYRSTYAVRTTDPEVLSRCQDGGAVTAILSQFLADGDGCAVVAGLEEGGVWTPKPVAALTKSEVVKGAGTKYTPCPILVGLDSAVEEHRKGRVAVVGTPCQIRALRRIESNVHGDVNLADAVALQLGLFCMETFGYDGFMEFLRGEGVDPAKVEKFDIKRGRLLAHGEGRVLYETKLSRVKGQVRPCCEECEDFTAEFSDLSLGNVGSPDGWSTVIVRTARGEKALRSAEKAGLIEVKPLEEGKAGLEAVVKLARRKKRKEAKAEE